MINISVKQLRYFEALAREGHFGRAAERCAISQPALSLQIKELEATMGGPLFERGARQVSLTGLGEAFAERAREVLRGVEELGALAKAAQEGLAGQLRLGVIPTVAPYLLPGVITALAGSFPGLDLRLRETLTATLVDELKAGQLDAAIVALPVSDPGLIETPLFDEAFVLVRHESDASRPVPDRKDLSAMRLLLLEEGHCFRDQALSFCETGPRRSREMLDGSTLSTLVQMVGAGIGVTLIPEMAVSVETRSAPVSVNHFAAPAPQRTIGMVWRATSPILGELEAVSDLVLEVAQAQGLARAP
ncbi:MAG: LysR substrate-binding domain-containing protein [Pseudomonadota bacterium]